MNKIKTHIKKHKSKYLFISGGITFAGITILIMRRTPFGDHLSGQWRDATTFVDKSQTVNNSSLFNSHIGPITNNYDSKRLSYIVSLDGSDKYWLSQSDAARETGISEPRLSRHLNYGDPFNGDISFTRRGIAV
jgi:hypothetical protein